MSETSNLPAVENRTLSHAFERVLRESPDKVAHIGDEAQYTFAQAHERALRIAGALSALGVRRQDTVAFLLDNSLDATHTWMGITLGGMIEVPINTAYVGDFLVHILNDCGARVIIADAVYVDRVVAVADRLTDLHTIIVRGDARTSAGALQCVPFSSLTAAEPADVVPNRAEDLVAYMYTSGTTGASKGVLITHAHAYTYASREDRPTPTSNDRFLVTLPVFHLAGQWYGEYQALIHSATAIIRSGFSVSGFWPTVRKHDVTYTLLLGAMAEMLQQRPAEDDDADNPLRLAPMAPLASNIRDFCERFALDAEPVYGMSEIGAVMGCAPKDLKPGGAGLARNGYQLRIVDEQGNDVPPGNVGELWVRADSPLMMMSGYHRLPEKTAATLIDGWVHTGDAFRVDDDGHYFFEDRIKDALRRRGENVSSFEVERVINTHPDVLESAVVAVPSELSEDEIKAVVVLRDDVQLDHRSFIRYLAGNMPYFMVPRYVEVIDELPKTPTQKISKHVLRDRPIGGSVWDRVAEGIEVTRRGTNA
ncbi:AMP-binding protein [Cumulibacter soli]|uniref:AMP-binding protein n=1 Tax=Cumulibacter soli TaxID=2546344 RepID=UPI0010679ACD|nr:AMP-binding protein [Cumulibacter soli]